MYLLHNLSWIKTGNKRHHLHNKKILVATLWLSATYFFFKFCNSFKELLKHVIKSYTWDYKWPKCNYVRICENLLILLQFNIFKINILHWQQSIVLYSRPFFNVRNYLQYTGHQSVTSILILKKFLKILIQL